jgi:diguanylate cyclase (GGDEF)-like protein
VYDFAGRYGGEEFVVVLPHCVLSDALRRAEEFRMAIADTPVPTNAGPVRVTCSIGVAVSAAGTTPEALMHRADDAMYCAKRAGRNRVFADTALGSAESL